MKTVGAKLPKSSDIIAVLHRRQAARLAVFSPPIDEVQRTLLLPFHGELQIIIQTQHETQMCRGKIKRKLHVYPVFMMLGVITQELIQYLCACRTDLVWRSFGWWPHTIRTGFAPSELVVKTALQNTLGGFIRIFLQNNKLAKLIADRQDPDRAHPCQNAT